MDGDPKMKWRIQIGTVLIALQQSPHRTAHHNTALRITRTSGFTKRGSCLLRLLFRDPEHMCGVGSWLLPDNDQYNLLPSCRSTIFPGRLLILDEVHLLHEERGAVLESIVARTTGGALPEGSCGRWPPEQDSSMLKSQLYYHNIIIVISVVIVVLSLDGIIFIVVHEERGLISQCIIVTNATNSVQNRENIK